MDAASIRCCHASLVDTHTHTQLQTLPNKATHIQTETIQTEVCTHTHSDTVSVVYAVERTGRTVVMERDGTPPRARHLNVSQSAPGISVNML